MVLIDDDPAAYQLQPDNAIHIEPFNNPRDKSDTSLEDLIPILAALVNEEVQDFPATLSTFSSREARDISAEYMTKLSSVKERQDRAQTRGLGGFIRQNSIRQTVPMAEEKAPGAEIVAAALAGKDPLEKTDLPPQGAMKKKGRFWDSLDAAKKEADEARQKKVGECSRKCAGSPPPLPRNQTPQLTRAPASIAIYLRTCRCKLSTNSQSRKSRKERPMRMPSSTIGCARPYRDIRSIYAHPP